MTDFTPEFIASQLEIAKQLDGRIVAFEWSIDALREIVRLQTSCESVSEKADYWRGIVEHARQMQCDPTSNVVFDMLLNMKKEYAILQAENDRLREALGKSIESIEEHKRYHYYCEDSWYSCPKAVEGCADESQGDECNCGADEANAKIDVLVKNLREALGGEG